MLPKIDTNGGRGILLEQLRSQGSRQGGAPGGGGDISSSKAAAPSTPLPELRLLKRVGGQEVRLSPPPPGHLPRGPTLTSSIGSGAPGEDAATFDLQEAGAEACHTQPPRGRGILRPLGAEHGSGKMQRLRSQSPPPQPRSASRHPLDYDAHREQARERVREHNRQRKRCQKEEEARRQLEERERRERAEAAMPAVEEHRRMVARRAAEDQRRDRAAKESATQEAAEVLMERRERKQSYKTPAQRSACLRRSDNAGADAGSATEFLCRHRGCTRETARRRRRRPPSQSRVGGSKSPLSAPASRYASTPSRGGWREDAAAGSAAMRAGGGCEAAPLAPAHDTSVE